RIPEKYGLKKILGYMTLTFLLRKKGSFFSEKIKKKQKLASFNQLLIIYYIEPLNTPHDWWK
ncbi:hypothetical protein, partial [Lactobacillus kitasatonis]|uniref:hypothetical protein n=1 Tax=Lactobacillus kitasatonis TaxID=237446 RepID=UPI001F310CB0